MAIGAFLFDNNAISSSPIFSKLSTETAFVFTPACTPPEIFNWFAWIFDCKPNLIPALQICSVCCCVKNPF